MYIAIHVKFQLFLSHFNETWVFSTDFRKCLNMKFHENFLLGAELLHADRHMDRRTDVQTDMTKVVVAFRNFAKAPKNGILISKP